MDRWNRRWQSSWGKRWELRAFGILPSASLAQQFALIVQKRANTNIAPSRLSAAIKDILAFLASIITNPHVYILALWAQIHAILVSAR